MIEINKCTESTSNCSVCGAINFDRDASLNEKVSKLTNLWIGQNSLQKITLCNGCLCMLSSMLSHYIDKEVL